MTRYLPSDPDARRGALVGEGIGNLIAYLLAGIGIPLFLIHRILDWF